MAKIRIKDLPRGQEITKKDMKMVKGGSRQYQTISNALTAGYSTKTDNPSFRTPLSFEESKIT
jgi:hypothetical protein